MNAITNQCTFQSMPLPCVWGKDNEAKAVYGYQQLVRDRNHTYLKSGLVINPDFPKLGAGPWPLIPIQLTLMAYWRSNGSERLPQSKHAASQKGFCCQLQDNGNLVLKQQYLQIQGQKSICHRKWCDFVLLPEFLYRRLHLFLGSYVSQVHNFL